MMSEENKTVHGLWVGDELSAMELLTLKSFVAHGHTFHLWVYDKLKNDLPEGVILKDANSIISRDRVFRYRFKNQFGHGEGSLAGFSDLFRYKLLYEVGGWWVDMDVTCLRPFDHTEPYYFRAHHELKLVGNVMKSPPRSELMRTCYEEAEPRVNADNRDWNLPIQILNDRVEALSLSKFIVTGQSPSDEWHLLYPYVVSNIQVPAEYYFIHWLNEVWRTNELSKEVAFRNSVYHSLLTKHHVSFAEPTNKQRLKLAIESCKNFLISTLFGNGVVSDTFNEG